MATSPSPPPTPVHPTAPSPLIAYKHEDRLVTFVNWCEERCADGMWMHPETQPIYIATHGNSIAAMSTAVISKGSLLSQVPKRWILSPRNVSSPELAQILNSEEYMDDMTSVMKTTIAYIYESCRGVKSPWYGYFTSLSIPDTLLLWEPDEVALLKGTLAHEQYILDYGVVTNLYKNSVEGFFEKHKALFPDCISEVNVEVWRYAYIIVQSHCFTIDEYHGQALVPIADLFNHTHLGNEDIEFHVLRFVCDKCGKQISFGCEYGPSLCKQCNLNTATQCECHPPKRPKTDSEDSANNTDPEDRVDYRKMVDGKSLDLTIYDVPDTCDMVAVKDIIGPRQICSNYTQLSNSRLLSRYGFIDSGCQSDSVSLSAQLFDNIDPDRQEFWENKGFQLIEKLKTFNERNFQEMEGILQREACPPKGAPFAQWSTAVGLCGWVRFPLKVFTTILLLTAEEWEKFIGYKKLTEKAVFMMPFMFFFEVRGDLVDSDMKSYSNWLDLMDNALLAKQATYGQFEDFSAFQEEITRMRTESEAEISPRVSRAKWMRWREMLIVADCQRRVKQGKTQLRWAR